MIKFGNIKKEHLVGAAIGVGAVAVGYYLYKKNQNKVDSFLRKQGINIKICRSDLWQYEPWRIDDNKRTSWRFNRWKRTIYKHNCCRSSCRNWNKIVK